MEWSPQQAAALDRVTRWLETKNKQLFKFQGIAGTGKTTLAKHIAANVSGTTLFAAFTGKAALVLQQKGCTNASTIHRLIYHPKEASKKRLEELAAKIAEYGEDKAPDSLLREFQEEKKNAERPYFTLNMESDLRHAALLIVDECSMVDEAMGKDLLSFDTPILALGDPAQLPPVGGAGFLTNGKPDVMLTEIHRQAEGNPIIRLASTVRNKGDLEIGQYGESRVVGKQWMRDKPEIALEADQIIVGRNATRRAINRRVRELRGLPEGRPHPGDRIVCLRNNHDLGLLNGSIWIVKECHPGHDEAILTIHPEGSPEEVISVVSHMHWFQGREDSLSHWEKMEAEAFDFGYALTCHKSQGSQWNNVLIFDEGHCFGNNIYKWQYTAITRAAEKVTIAI